MTDEEEDPKELLAQEMARARDLHKKRDESKERAGRTRKIRVANGFDKFFADLLEGHR